MKQVIIVLQVGKVGSWTIIKSIQAVQPTMSLSHIASAGAGQSCIVHTHTAQHVKDWLAIKPADVEAFIISCVRDPLRMSISTFFQNIDNPKHRSGDRQYLYFGEKATVLAASPSQLVAHFKYRVVVPALQHAELFMQEFSKIIEQDAFALDFDALGMAAGAFDGGRFAVLRLHRFADALPRLGDILQVGEMTPVNTNIAEDKWYAEKYVQFLSHYKPTEEELELYYGSPLALGCFSEADVHDFRQKWL